MVAEKSTVWRSDGVFLEYCLDIVPESHVEHLVCFIEHDGLHGSKRDRSPVKVVEQPPGVAITIWTPDLSAGAAARWAGRRRRAGS